MNRVYEQSRLLKLANAEMLNISLDNPQSVRVTHAALDSSKLAICDITHVDGMANLTFQP